MDVCRNRGTDVRMVMQGEHGPGQGDADRDRGTSVAHLNGAHWHCVGTVLCLGMSMPRLKCVQRH
ncbi:hypothetical protein LguiB_027384 [Lonicera macranthoides]